MAGAYIWVLAGIFIVVLGVAIAFATIRWTEYRKHRTLNEKRQTDEATRQAFKEQGPD
ncbi:MAG TPA: hypothetical protein VKY54_02520 [Kiloniellales bacterium]|jgi:hypothetical protein|nr:hypothetical protein [Kiloniellales bacterium]